MSLATVRVNASVCYSAPEDKRRFHQVPVSLFEQQQLPYHGMAHRDFGATLNSLGGFLAACQALGAAKTGGPLSIRETRLLKPSKGRPTEIAWLRERILNGDDPLGEALAALKTQDERRRHGMVFTPKGIVRAMCAWVIAERPDRVVDAGCGSGRFSAEFARLERDLRIMAVDSDPLATLACRANLAVLGAKRARVLHADFLALPPGSERGKTAFVGNPPYVRHHALTVRQKALGKAHAGRLGLGISGLSGLHVYFLLACLGQAKPQDIACFITSAEWLDVNYGRTLKEALLRATSSLDFYVMDPETSAFSDALTTALVTCLKVGLPSATVGVRMLASGEHLDQLSQPRDIIRRDLLGPASGWRSIFMRPGHHPHQSAPCIGEHFRVSRGVATGANKFFALRPEVANRLNLMHFTTPVLSGADEVFQASGLVRADESRLRLLTPPKDIDLKCPKCDDLRSYLRMGQKAGVDRRYLCRHREPWWYVGRLRPAPIVATYMGRQPPAFALNPDGMVLLNVVHGLHPRREMTWKQMERVVQELNANREDMRHRARVYQGGLLKFEPREMEAVPFPENAIFASVTA